MKRRLTIISFGLLILTIMVLIIATFIEKVEGATFAHQHIYGSWYFVGLWLLLAISALALLLRYHRKGGRMGALLLHIALGVILLGAGLTYFFSQRGDLYLYKGEDTSSFTTKEGKSVELPFTVNLESFEILYYTGTQSPMDFVSSLRFNDGQSERVSMNHIGHHKQYRFYQSGYDEDQKGVRLSVAYDPWGIAFTYCGYGLLLVAMILVLVDPKGEFRRTLRQLSQARKVVPMLLLPLLLLCTSQSAYASSDRALLGVMPPIQAEQFGQLYVYHNGRICPMQSFARDLVTKLYGKPSYKGLTAEQVLTGWLLYPSDWIEVPMIRVKGAPMRSLLGTEKRYVSWQDFFDEAGEMKLSKALEALNTGHLPEGEARDLLALYEKYNIVGSLLSGQGIKMFPIPEGGSIRWMAQADRLPTELPEDEWLFIRRSTDYLTELTRTHHYDELSVTLEKIRRYQQKKAGELLPSEGRFQSERLYNQLSHTLPLAITLILLGVFYYILILSNRLRKQNAFRLLKRIGQSLIGLAALYLIVCSTLRGVSAGHIPLSNGFETMQFLALTILLIAFFLSWHSDLFLSFGMLSSGLALMVSVMGESNPQMTPLMPVLSSPLLSIHVIVMMLSYTLFCFLFFNGITGLVLLRKGKPTQQLTQLSRCLLYPALFLLTAGIFIGAVWANISWGRYWGWDPKETWALITMLVYALPLHQGVLKAFRKERFLHAYLIAAFMTILMTYFGVNFILGGLHGYA